MRPANPELEQKIKETALKMLLEKNPGEIGMRDIAKACNITPPTIYHYYKDKYTLFETVSITYLENLKSFMQERIEHEDAAVKKLKSALEAFRDWSFKNPQIAMLIMTKNKIKDDASTNDVDSYYICNHFGQLLLEQAIQEGSMFSDNPELDTDVVISGLWGCIEAILLKRTIPGYWQKGVAYTDHFIKLAMQSLLSK